MKKIRRDSLDILFSEFIRRRAIRRVHGCERCLTWKEDWKKLECSHFYGRSRKSVRWDPVNSVGLCFGCHQYLGSQPTEHVQWYENYIGREALDMLAGRERILHKPDKEALMIYYRQLLNVERQYPDAESWKE